MLLPCSDLFCKLAFCIQMHLEKWMALAPGVSLSLSLSLCRVFFDACVAIAPTFTVSMSLIIRRHDIPLRVLKPRCCYAISSSYTQTHLYTSIMYASFPSVGV